MFKIFKLKLVVPFFLFLFLTFSSLPPTVFASDESSQILVSANTLPSSTGRLVERITLYFKFNNNAKYDYYKYTLEKRLAELAFVAENKHLPYFEETSKRYSTYVGNTSNFVIKNNLSIKKQELLSIFKRHQQIINKLIDKYPVGTSYWLLLKDDSNTLQIFIQKISQL